MKKIIILLALFCPTAFAQDSTKNVVDSLKVKKMVKNEVSVDWFALISNDDIQVSYERLLKNNRSISITAALNDYTGFSEEISDRELKSFGIYASYDFYFSEKQHQGFFVSPVVKFQNIYDYKYDYNKYGYYPFWGFGLKMGAKFVHKKITFTPQISLFRNVFSKDYIKNINDIEYPDFGLSAKIGYRF